MSALLEIVKQRPFAAKDTCPFCGSTALGVMGTKSTLIGSVYEGTDDDPNHRWIYCRCTNCGRHFTEERKGRNVWYTKDGFVLAGLPACFESYTFTCAKCGENKVTKRHTALDGTTVVHALTAYGGVKQYRTFYSCSACKAEVEVPEEYWGGQ